MNHQTARNTGLRFIAGLIAAVMLATTCPAGQPVTDTCSYAYAAEAPAKNAAEAPAKNTAEAPAKNDLVRPYKIVNGDEVYGPYSPALKIVEGYTYASADTAGTSASAAAIKLTGYTAGTRSSPFRQSSTAGK